MSDLEKLEKFYNFLISTKSTKNKEIPRNYLGIKETIKTYLDQFNKLLYFNYILKDNTKESLAKLNMAIDFRCMMKYYEFQSYLVGATVLYFMLLFSKKKNIFGLFSIFSCVTALGVTFWYQYYHNSRIFKAIDAIFFKDIEYLYKKLKKEEGGFSTKMIRDFHLAEESVKKSDKVKFEKNSSEYKPEYMDQNYSIEDREKLVDLVKFYSEWLYGPVDEDVENKLYFLSENRDEYFHNSLKNLFNQTDMNEKEKIKNLFGIKNISI